VSSNEAPPTGPDRRQFLRAAGLVTGGLVVGGVSGAVIGDQLAGSGTTQPAAATSQDVVSFYGEHQPGVVGAAPAHLRFVSLTLSPATVAAGRIAVGKLQKGLSDAASDMMAGRWISQQSTVLNEMSPAGLTVTFAFGSRMVTIAGQDVPTALAALPGFRGEALQPDLSGGDLAFQVCGSDEMVVAATARALAALARPAATPKWTQAGFLPGTGSRDPNGTPRNLMGQLDGTDNPTGARLKLAVWVAANVSPSWMKGGTYLVTRRIRMRLNDWDRLNVDAKEQVIGRKLGSGAPLSGGTEHATPSFTAVDSSGKAVIPANAHLRLTHPANNGGSTMLRRGYSYDEGQLPGGTPNAGLFFQAFQTDPHAVFVPIQQKLAQSDALSMFLRHEGSAIFAVPPGATPGGWVGETLFGF
jgi:dye decolorizing peroxidase